MQVAQLRCGDVASRRVVGIGQIDHMRIGSGQACEGLYIGAQIRLRGDHRGRARRPRGNRVDQETEFAEQHIVAGSGVAFRQQGKQLVRAVAADDALRIDAVTLGQGGSQGAGAAVGIAVQGVGRLLVGLDCARAGAEGRFVGGQPGDVGARCRRSTRSAGDIGLDVEYPRLGGRRAHGLSLA